MTSVLILLSGFDPGTYYIEDDGIPNNGIAQLRGPDGSVIFFNIPTEFLTITASAGRSVIINLTESFGAADINVGSLTNPAENPDSIQIQSIRGAGDVLLAANGAITELGADAAADINASTLILSAGTGVGTAGNALETQVGTLEAETSTGGINLANAGNLVIGGLSTEVAGLDVETSGNLTLTNSGTITLTDETDFESVHGGNSSGNVTLIANGANSDITSLVDQDAIAAPGGSIILTAGRDVSLGTAGLNFDNDVRARGDLIITTGRDLNVDGFADLASDGYGAGTGGNLIVNAGRDINILNATGTDASLGAEGSAGGDVILNAGPGAFVRLLATSSSTLFSSSGNVTVNADRLVINATAGITANAGEVFLRPRTSGWAIDLGSAVDGAFALELSDAELDRIFTPTLRIGDGNSGPLSVTSAISPAGAADMILRSGTNIHVAASMTVTGLLTLRAADNIFTLPASTITAGGFDALIDEFTNDEQTGGVGIFNGAIAAAAITLRGSAEADTLNGSGAGETILGNGGNDTLRGFGGGDTLNGGTGADTMDGGLGNDFFFVDNAADVVIEAASEGSDRIFASASYTLGAGVSVEMFTTDNNLGTAAINLTGNELVQSIYGNDGNNNLDGKGGADLMSGRLGNDNFYVDNAADQVEELAGQGTDRVYASVSYQLAAGQSVELFSTDSNTGTTAITLIGNELANAVYGNDGNNVLDGRNGSDLLTGRGGADTFGFTTTLGAGNLDTIADFVTGVDKIQLGITLFTSLAAGALPASAFVVGAAAADASDRIIYNNATGALLYDADGVGGAAAVQFATLSGAPALAASDFFVI